MPSADRSIDTGYLTTPVYTLSTPTDGAWCHGHLACYFLQFLPYMSCMPPLLLQHAVEEIVNITRYSLIARWNAYELGRTTGRQRCTASTESYAEKKLGIKIT